jgi:hypothetical protein
MKTLLYLCMFVLVVSACSPRIQKMSSTCFVGKLVKKGICGQRVIRLISAPVELVVIESKWTDSLSHKKYIDVFTVANPCDFPASIKEGETFTFSITGTPGSGCIQCFAYTPVPKAKNNITIGCAQ